MATLSDAEIDEIAKGVVCGLPMMLAISKVNPTHTLRDFESLDFKARQTFHTYLCKHLRNKLDAFIASSNQP